MSSYNCRIGRVIDKRTSREIVLVNTEAKSQIVRKKLERDWRYIQDRGWATNIRGFALVCWNGAGAATTALYAEGGPIARGYAPDFVKTALTDHVTRGFARDDVMSELFPSRPFGA